MDALLCALCRSEGGAYMDDPASGSRRYCRRCIAKAGTRVALAQSVHVKEHSLGLPDKECVWCRVEMEHEKHAYTFGCRRCGKRPDSAR
jgi:hypothetical protein